MWLRVVHLSGIWPQVYQAYLQKGDNLPDGMQEGSDKEKAQKGPHNPWHRRDHTPGVRAPLLSCAPKTMWRCPKRRSKVDDRSKGCGSCGTTPDGVEDPNFVTADEADPIPDEELPEGTELDDPLADFAGTPMPDLVQCYMASDTIEAKFIADQLMEQGIPVIADRFEVASDSFRRSR